MGGAVGERCVEHGFGHLTGLRRGHAATRTEWTEVDLEAQRLGRFDRRYHVGAGLALDERFDGELQQQHACEL